MKKLFIKIKELIELAVWCPPKVQFPEFGERVNVNTIIEQQRKIEQLEVELSKYKAVDGWVLKGQQLYIKED